jgi:DNA-binding transcriptional regulator YiaG
MSNTSEATTKAKEQQYENEPRESEATGSDSDADAFQPKPDVSDMQAAELLPLLLEFFNNNREELARALGLHRSSIDRWLNGKSRPNNSTLLRMRRLVQERGVV